MGLTSADLKLKAGLVSGEYTKKHRYFMFIGNKKEVKRMKGEMIYEILPYPKGENKSYDASHKPIIQNRLF